MDRDEKLLADAKGNVLKGLCDGSCNPHAGEIRLVRVTGTGSKSLDRIPWAYCEEAVQEDLRRGLKVESWT